MSLCKRASMIIRRSTLFYSTVCCCHPHTGWLRRNLHGIYCWCTDIDHTDTCSDIDGQLLQNKNKKSTSMCIYWFQKMMLRVSIEFFHHSQNNLLMPFIYIKVSFALISFKERYLRKHYCKWPYVRWGLDLDLFDPQCFRNEVIILTQVESQLLDLALPWSTHWSINKIKVSIRKRKFKQFYAFCELQNEPKKIRDFCKIPTAILVWTQKKASHCSTGWGE